jgi:hypothetical protein
MLSAARDCISATELCINKPLAHRPERIGRGYAAFTLYTVTHTHLQLLGLGLDLLADIELELSTDSPPDVDRDLTAEELSAYLPLVADLRQAHQRGLVEAQRLREDPYLMNGLADEESVSAALDALASGLAAVGGMVASCEKTIDEPEAFIADPAGGQGAHALQLQLLMADAMLVTADTAVSMCQLCSAITHPAMASA